jgi:hypothetical protein
MRKRPLSITIISWLLVAAGVVGIAYHASEFDSERPLDPEFLWVCSIRLLAILCGVFMLRGRNWARWLLVLWLGYHVGLSAVHELSALVVHSLLFAVVLGLLFRSRASAYFRSAAKATANPEPDDV